MIWHDMTTKHFRHISSFLAARLRCCIVQPPDVGWIHWCQRKYNLFDQNQWRRPGCHMVPCWSFKGGRISGTLYLAVKTIFEYFWNGELGELERSYTPLVQCMLQVKADMSWHIWLCHACHVCRLQGLSWDTVIPKFIGPSLVEDDWKSAYVCRLQREPMGRACDSYRLPLPSIAFYIIDYYSSKRFIEPTSSLLFPAVSGRLSTVLNTCIMYGYTYWYWYISICTRVWHMSVHITYFWKRCSISCNDSRSMPLTPLINPLDPSTELIYYNARNGYKDLDLESSSSGYP